MELTGTGFDEFSNARETVASDAVGDDVRNLEGRVAGKAIAVIVGPNDQFMPPLGTQKAEFFLGLGTLIVVDLAVKGDFHYNLLVKENTCRC